MKWSRRFRPHLVVLGTVVLLVALGLAYVASIMRQWRATWDPITDVNRYGAILGSLTYPKPAKPGTPTTAHFPSAIPAIATNIRFYYQPHFLQGGLRFQLRMGLPANDLAALIDTLEPFAEDVQAGGSMFDAANERKGLPSAMFRNAANTDFAELPRDFQVFVLDAKSPDNWNHGYSYGVAANEKTGEVVYWLEDW